MFNKILIANRGEIACRIIRTARRLDMQTVAIYARGENGALHSRLADNAAQLPESKTMPYLNIAAIVKCAKQSGADAVHPGFGFLSENAAFAKACINAGLVFIGPSPEVMAVAGAKTRARKLAQQAGARILPGLPINQNGYDKVADNIGYPLMLKAAAGGGGRGMRIVNCKDDLPLMLQQARRESKNAFGNGALLAEKYLPQARHLEVQILADKHNKILTLGERDCSMQRRHQKVIEESPAPFLDNKLRRELHACAHNIAKAANYENAGTIEFLLDDNSGKLYFLEINARLQVEHPLTEALYGIDLVEWQMRIAAGKKLAESFPPIPLPKWAMEARVCAENPLHKLLPSVGLITQCHLPQLPGVRIDSGIAAGEIIGGEYDSLLAKVIATGATREQTRKRLLQALQKTRIDGITTNIPYLAALAESAPFVDGKTRTATAENIFDDTINIVRRRRRKAILLAAAFVALTAPCLAAGFRLNDNYRRAFVVLYDDEECRRCQLQIGNNECRITDDDGVLVLKDYHIIGGGISAQIGGDYCDAECTRIDENSICVFYRGLSLVLHIGERQVADATSEGGGDCAIAPMPGVVLAVMAKRGDRVCRGDALVMLEAMKMEMAVAAPRNGIIATMECAPGDIVAAGSVLARIDANGDSEK